MPSVSCVIRSVLCDMRYALCNMQYVICVLRSAFCVLRSALCIMRLGLPPLSTIDFQSLQSKGVMAHTLGPQRMRNNTRSLDWPHPYSSSSSRPQRSSPPPVAAVSRSLSSRSIRTASTGAGFQASTHGPRSSPVCAVCLGSHTHSFIDCTAEHIWDNTYPTSATRTNKHLLLQSSGKSLCVDWQRGRSCSNRSHDDRHICAGCLSNTHGAQGCTRAQTVPPNHSI
jgi:hypothetical protein